MKEIYMGDLGIVVPFLDFFKLGYATSFPGPFLKWSEGKGSGTDCYLLQFHWLFSHIINLFKTVYLSR